MIRPLRNWAANAIRNERQQSSCNKGQPGGKKLIPGIMFQWCANCRKCVNFSVMEVSPCNTPSPQCMDAIDQKERS